MESFVKRFMLVDYVILAGMLLASSLIGIFHGFFTRRSATTEEVLLGSKEMKPFPTAMSLIASFISAIFLLGAPAEIYNFGTQFLVMIISHVLVTAASTYLFMPIFYNLKITSAYEYLSMRFNNYVRLIGYSLFLLETYLSMRFNNYVRLIGYSLFLLETVLVMPITVYAPSLALHQVTGLNIYATVVAVFVICMFYTSVGGMRAVIWTDTFQTILMFAAMAVTAVKGTMDVGGAGVVWNRSVSSDRMEFFNMDLDPTIRHTFWSVLFGTFFVRLSMNAANQSQIQRYLSISSIKEVKTALWIYCAGIVSLTAMCGYIELLIYAKYFDCDPLASQMFSMRSVLRLYKEILHYISASIVRVVEE